MSQEWPKSCQILYIGTLYRHSKKGRGLAHVTDFCMRKGRLTKISPRQTLNEINKAVDGRPLLVVSTALDASDDIH